MKHRAKLVVIATFSALACFYVVSLAAAVIVLGPSQFLEAVLRIPDFVVLFTAAIVEAVGCFAVAVMSSGSAPRVAGCAGLALILAVGGVVILAGGAARSPVPGMWPLALAGIALHLWGLLWAWIRVRNEAL